MAFNRGPHLVEGIQYCSLFTVTLIESSPDAVFISREKIVDLIGANKVVVLSGETGCGKTTQVTKKFIFE